MFQAEVDDDFLGQLWARVGGNPLQSPVENSVSYTGQSGIQAIPLLGYHGDKTVHDGLEHTTLFLPSYSGQFDENSKTGELFPHSLESTKVRKHRLLIKKKLWCATLSVRKVSDKCCRGLVVLILGPSELGGLLYLFLVVWVQASELASYTEMYQVVARVQEIVGMLVKQSPVRDIHHLRRVYRCDSVECH